MKAYFERQKRRFCHAVVSAEGQTRCDSLPTTANQILWLKIAWNEFNQNFDDMQDRLRFYVVLNDQGFNGKYFFSLTRGSTTTSLIGDHSCDHQCAFSYHMIPSKCSMLMSVRTKYNSFNLTKTNSIHWLSGVYFLFILSELLPRCFVGENFFLLVFLRGLGSTTLLSSIVL